MKERFHFFWGNASPFSQWHRAGFEVDGIHYNSAEQYMMWGKAMLFEDAEIAAQILLATNPRKQKSLGRKVSNFDKATWEKNARDIVYKANRAKFSQNAHLKSALLETKGYHLVEAAPNDRIWGIGLAEDDPRAHNRATWLGTNWLGEILNRLREELLAE